MIGEFRLGSRSLKNMEGLHPDMVKVVNEALRGTTQDFGIAGKAVRTVEEQEALYAQGRTRSGKIVTFKDGVIEKSNHQVHDDGFGWAVDLTPFINGHFDVNNEEAQYPIAVAMSYAAKKLGVRIRWGGNWHEVMNDYGSRIEEVKTAMGRYHGSHDLPHFELVK